MRPSSTQPSSMTNEPRMFHPDPSKERCSKVWSDIGMTSTHVCDERWNHNDEHMCHCLAVAPNTGSR